MNRIKNILILIMLFLVCSARTCTENEETIAAREKQNTIKLMHSVENAFSSGVPEDSLLRAYEMTAMDKLKDFAEYLKIISDTTLEPTFRKHTAESVRNMFVPGKIELQKLNKYYSQKGLNNLDQLLENSLSQGNTCWINPSQVNVADPFMQINDSTYIGALSFVPVCIPFFSNEQPVLESGKAEMEIYLLKRIKYFGDKKIRSWEVFLGDIN